MTRRIIRWLNVLFVIVAIFAAIKADCSAATPTSESRAIDANAGDAMRVRNAIRRGDYPLARGIVAEVLARSHIENWGFHPFAEFIADIRYTNDPGLASRLEEWVAQDGNDAIALLMRAKYYYDIGWLMRGHGFVSQTQANRMAGFAGDMAKAFEDVSAAIRLDEGNPYAYYLELRILKATATRL